MQAAPVAAAASAFFKSKINESLKPSKLTMDNKQEEFRSWLRKFRTSQLDRCTTAEQQAYFFICMDVNLETSQGKASGKMLKHMHEYINHPTATFLT